MEFLADRAKMNYELKQQEFKMLKEQQEAMAKQQLQTQQQQTEMFKVMQQQQQQQSWAMMALLEKLANKWSMDLCHSQVLQHILLHCISFP